MNKAESGDMAEAVVIAELKKFGITVLTPFGDNERYDLVIERSHREFERVQVKKGWRDDGKIKFKSCSTVMTQDGYNGREDYSGDVDSFIVYDDVEDSLYYVPIDEASDTTTSLRLVEPELNHPSVKMADDFHFSDEFGS